MSTSTAKTSGNPSRNSQTVRRDWIATEFAKGIEAEHTLIDEARCRIRSEMLPTLEVLYNEIIHADERHENQLEAIAIRYGHTPTRASTGGIGETLGRLKDKVTELGASPMQRLGHDLCAKANAIHWYKAWIATFEEIGDPESARELAAILQEETSHRDALQEGLNRLVIEGAINSEPTAKPA